MDRDELQEWYRRALKSRIEALESTRVAARPAVSPDPSVLLATQLRASETGRVFPRIARAAAALEAATPEDVSDAVDELLSALREAALGLTSPERPS